jgi:hypothetical protein
MTLKIQYTNLKLSMKVCLKCHEKTFKIVGIVKDLDPELDLKLFASQLGSGSKTQRKMGFESEKKWFRIHNPVYCRLYTTQLVSISPICLDHIPTYLGRDRTRNGTCLSLFGCKIVSYHFVMLFKFISYLMSDSIFIENLPPQYR